MLSIIDTTLAKHYFQAMRTTIRVLWVLIIFAIATSAFAFTTTGFKNPYGIAVDPKTNFIYVSSVNGGLVDRDKNGFISRLKGDGSVDQLKFIDGATTKEINLSAPKGMAILGMTLYVADIDKLHAFDASTGKFLFDVNFGDLPVQHFFDVKVGPDDALYVVDGPGNTIYRVEVAKLHEVTTFASGEGLGQPHGICWYAARQNFVVAGWSSGQISVFDRTGKRVNSPTILLRTTEGITADDYGNFYVVSTALSSIYKLAPNFALSSFGLGVDSPAGIAFQRTGNQILVVSFDAGTVKTIAIPASSPSQ